MRRPRTGHLPLLALTVATGSLWLAAPEARACSICRCGDATFNALGRDAYGAAGFHLAFDWERFDKQEGDPAEEAEAQVEQRFTTLVSYGFNDRLAVRLRVPYSVRSLTTVGGGAETGPTDTRGLSDPEILGQVRLWASALRGPLGRRAVLSMSAGVKTPWGRNDVEVEGERADEHAQPGTGSTDLLGSLAFLYLVDERSAVFASTGYRRTGENDAGYRYGSTFLANLAYERKLHRAVDGVLELNFRQAGQDRVEASGTLDGDTGGALLYVTPRLAADLGHGLVLRAAVQVPLAKGLNGFQEERAVVNAGLTYLFPHR